MNSKTFLIILSKRTLCLRFIKDFIALFLLVACKSKQPLAVANSSPHISENCPENGACGLEVLQNKTLNILKGDFGNTYTEMAHDNHLVLKFKFEKNLDVTAVDGHYIEKVFIELDPNNLEKDANQLKHE